MIHIAQDGSGDFTSIQEALDSLPSDNPSETILFIHKGIYKERLTITVPYVTFLGESRDDTILTYDRYAQMPSDDIGKLGTFRSYSCLIDTHDFTARHITFENTAGPGTKVGQALALYADGDRLHFFDCRFLGGQDTLFTAPLPPKEIEPNGFIGPKQSAPRRTGRHYYQNCYIEGDIDFIFGGAAAFFDHCELFSKYTGQSVNSYVTAASTPEGQKYGYVFDHCRFTSDCPPHSCYLGRPWREYAKTVLTHCWIGEHICPEGWHDWGKTTAHKTAYYAEYQNAGPGADINARPAWIHKITPEESLSFQKSQVLAGNDNWNP